MSKNKKKYIPTHWDDYVVYGEQFENLPQVEKIKKTKKENEDSTAKWRKRKD